MATLSTEKKAAVIRSLVEGCSIRTTERLTGVARTTIGRLLLATGQSCDRMMADQIRHVRPSQIQLDEVWSFVGKKQRHLKAGDDATLGDWWTWVAIDPETKLVPHHHVSKTRQIDECTTFVRELRRRVEGRVQISSDRLANYSLAIAWAWRDQEVDYGRIVKRFQTDWVGEGRYSPPKVVGIDKDVVFGTPEESKISTSIVERSHLTMRTQIRRMTRLTLGFSKKADALRASINLHFAHYNFCRTHGSLKTTPAIAAGVTDRRLSIEEIAELPY